MYVSTAAAAIADKLHVYCLSLAFSTIELVELLSFIVRVFCATFKTAFALRRNCMPSTNGMFASITKNVQRRITCALNSTLILHAIEVVRTRPSGIRTFWSYVSITGSCKA